MQGVFAQNILKGDSLSNTGKFSQEYDQKRTNEFIDTLNQRLETNKWTRELRNIVIMAPNNPISDTVKTEKSELKYEPWAGKEINQIRFIKIDPFGRSVRDTNFQYSWLNNAGNTLHVKTSDRVLERHLLFQKGDKLDPNIIADNERLIRELSFIEDVRIFVNGAEDNPDMVNVTILSKDVWSKAFFVELSGLNEGKLEIWDRNILGSGKEIQANIHWNPDKKEKWGMEAFYVNKNILGTFIDSKISYQNIFDLEYYGIKLERKFFTPNTEYAGGVNLGKTNSIKNIWYTDTSYIAENINFTKSDIWVGRSFALDKKNGFYTRRLNLTLSSRFYSEDFTDRPQVEKKFLHQYHNKSVWLNSISFTSRSFYKSNLIYSYGRTEDIPNGLLANFTIGKEFGEFTNRTYSSFSFSMGDYLLNIGYLYGMTRFGGFFEDIKDYQQGVFNLKLDYFTNLLIFGNFKFRHFIRFNYLKGVNRFPLERININDRNGIRGLIDNSIYGQKKINLSIESVMFTPYQLYGFKIVFFEFADFSLIGPESKNFIDYDAYSGLGFGIRLRNERLVFPTFQLRFAIYPNVEGLLLEDLIKFSGEKKLNPNNFSPEAPSILKY